MVEPRAKNGVKRQNENAANTPQKRQRTSGPTDAAMDADAITPGSPAPKKIIDLIDDCLETIFGHLDLHSLFSVGVASEWLRPAANVVYKRKFSNNMINFHGVQLPHDFHYYRAHAHAYTNIKEYFSVCFGKVSFTDFKICLQFLRCFGSSLSNVHMYYHGSNSQRYDYIHQYLNKYCAETLLELELIIKPRLLIKHFDKPFVKVQTVALHYCHLGEQFPSFRQWFPNARSLKQFNVLMDDRWVDEPFEHLEYVRIDVNNGLKRDGFTKTEAVQLLRSCRQLKSLEIHMPGRQGMNMPTLLNIIEEKLAIEVLALCMDRYCTTPKLTEIQRLINEHPLLVELHVKNFKFTIGSALAVIRQLNRLKTFYFQFNDPLESVQLANHLDGNQWKIRTYVSREKRYAFLTRRI